MRYRPYNLVYRKVPIPKKNLVLFTMREDTLARTELWKTWIVDHGVTEFIDLPNKNVLEYYWDDKSHMEFFTRYSKYILKNYGKYKDEYGSHKRRIIRDAKSLGSCKDKKKLAREYKRYIDSGYSFCRYIFGPWANIYSIEPKVMEKFSDSADIILSLDRPIEFLKMQNDLSRLSIEQLELKYGWLSMYNPNEAPYTKQDFKRFKKEGVETIPNYSRNKKIFQEFIQDIKDKSMKRKIEVMHFHAFLKTDRVDTWRKAMFLTSPFYCHISRELGISLTDACNMTITETLGFLENGTAPNRKRLIQRSVNKVVYVYTKNTIFIDSGILKWRTRLDKSNKSSSFKGTIACMGKVRGKAKIISTQKDLEKIEEGDIFVARFTYPTFTPYMVRAAAIVTDDGGLTSHAAIIAREYRKPCIVGTKVGTKILKEGDIVEVDANTGVVKKL